MTPRKIKNVITSISVIEGGGFPVRRPFPTRDVDNIDPFLLLDHMGPKNWGPGEAIGAPEHPHRGFETVTYLLEGKMQHADSWGNSGKLNPGDVQWMTAGSGLMHAELPDPEFKKKGGVVNGFQLWVNLPAKLKMIEPRYQDTPAEKIPDVYNEDKTIKTRVVAGDFNGYKGPIETNIPIQYFHSVLQPGAAFSVAVTSGHTAIVYIIKGWGKFHKEASDIYIEGQCVVYEDEGDSLDIENVSDTQQDLSILILTGEKINEPIARYGPFVMNTQAEIAQTFEDYQAGKLGRIG